MIVSAASANNEGFNRQPAGIARLELFPRRVPAFTRGEVGVLMRLQGGRWAADSLDDVFSATSGVPLEVALLLATEGDTAEARVRRFAEERTAFFVARSLGNLRSRSPSSLRPFVATSCACCWK